MAQVTVTMFDIDEVESELTSDPGSNME